MNIRESMMKEKNEGMFPLPPLSIRQSAIKSTSIQPLFITGFLWLLTCFAAGFLSGPSAVLFAMMLFFYLRFDYLYLKMRTSGKSLLLMKGFYFFKTHKPREVMLSQIISLRQARFSRHSELQLRYFNLNDGHFYDESMECPNTEADELLKALAINKIATGVK